MPTRPAGRPWLIRILREPLLHFLVLGALIFGLYFWLNGTSAAISSPHQIKISAPTIASLEANWQRQWGQSPSPEDLQTLIDQYIRDEILYREALALGLDQNDIIVRRRLIQKVEFLAEDISALQEPGDGVLQAYLDEHRDRYVIPGRVSFDQLYFSRERWGDGADEEAEKVLQHIQANPDKLVASDRSMLPQSLTLATFQEMAGVFGERFARNLFTLTAPGWHGPFHSAYGSHLVNVTEIEPGHSASLAEVRNDVRLDWLRNQKQRQDEQFYQALRERYTVIFDESAWDQAIREVAE
jgi:hypothetical protein